MKPLERAEIEELLYHEAALLDEWRLRDWLALLTEDARYEVPTNDAPDGDSTNTLFIIADDIHRIRARVTRLEDPSAHAEYPPSRTRRMIGNVRLLGEDDRGTRIGANFVIYRFRAGERIREYVGRYRMIVVRTDDGRLRIRYRRAMLDAFELGGLGSVSIIL